MSDKQQPAPPSLGAVIAEWHRRVQELESAAICEFHDKPKNFCGTCANELVGPGQKAMEELAEIQERVLRSLTAQDCAEAYQSAPNWQGVLTSLVYRMVQALKLSPTGPSKSKEKAK